MSLAGLKEFRIAEGGEPCADGGDVFAQQLLLFGEGICAVEGVEVLVQGGEVVPAVAFGGEVGCFAVLFVSFPLQEGVCPAKLVAQVFGGSAFTVDGAVAFQGVRDVGKFREILVEGGLDGGDEGLGVGVGCHFLRVFTIYE